MFFHSASWRRFVYTLWSPFYDQLVRIFRPMRQRSIARLNLQPGQRVLIVGAGTGLDLEFLPRLITLTAIDLTPAMLAHLQRRADHLGLQVTTRVMDATTLDFPTDSFDAVILHLIVAVVPNPIACVQEASRVLRSGGRMVIMDKFHPDDQKPPLLFRLLAPLTSCLGTEITRHLGPILAASPLTLISNEPAAFHGLFRIILAEKR